MKKFWSTSAKVHSLLSTRLGLYYANDSPATFPRFSELPAELRDQIWIHSLEQRVIPLHLRQYPHDESSIEISTLTGNEEIGEAMHENVIVAQNDEVTTSDMTGGEGEEGSTTADSEQDEANSESTEGDNGIDREYQLFTMAILTCSMEGRCKCNYLPPSSIHTVPPPAAFSVCRESREATRYLYTKYLEAEYNINGFPATGSNGIRLAKHYKPRINRAGRKPSSLDDIYSPTYPYPFQTGVFINPTVDTLMVDLNIASSGSIQELQHFVNIMSKQLPNMTRIVVSTVIALRPYMWSRKERFEYWKTMGHDAKWVPRNMVQFPHLRDVVVLLGGETHEKMLPIEWRERTANIWSEEMERVRETWPDNWINVGPPVLRVVRKLKDM